MKVFMAHAACVNASWSLAGRDRRDPSFPGTSARPRPVPLQFHFDGIIRILLYLGRPSFFDINLHRFTFLVFMAATSLVISSSTSTWMSMSPSILWSASGGVLMDIHGFVNLPGLEDLGDLGEPVHHDSKDDLDPDNLVGSPEPSPAMGAGGAARGG